jgi:acetyl esterase/lipase
MDRIYGSLAQLGRRRPLLLGLLAGVGLLLGCAPARLLDAVTPAGNYRLERDLVYGELPRQRLDIYHPAGREGGPIVVFFYGGSWRSGDKGGYRFVGEQLTRHGITLVVPDYRPHPDVTFPAFVEDGARALRWVQDNLASGDGTRVFVMGHSAGAHIAALLAFDKRYGTSAGLRPNLIAGLVGISGPYDFLPLTEPRTRAVFGALADDPVIQPITFVGVAAPPTLLLHGTTDSTVHPRNSESLAASLRRAGVPVRLQLYGDRGHVDIMLGLSSALDSDGRLVAELLDFLRGEAANRQ